MFGSPLPLTLGDQQSLVSTQQMLPPDMPQIAKRAGMFGQGGVGRNIAGMIGDFLLQRAGMQPIYQPTMMEKWKQERENAQYERQLADQKSLIDYRAAHKEPDEFTQMMQAAGIDPNSEQGKALYLQAVQNKANPFTAVNIQNPDGSETRQFMRPPQIPTAPVGKLTPFGGPTPPASGGFPGY